MAPTVTPFHQQRASSWGYGLAAGQRPDGPTVELRQRSIPSAGRPAAPWGGQSAAGSYGSRPASVIAPPALGRWSAPPGWAGVPGPWAMPATASRSGTGQRWWIAAAAAVLAVVVATVTVLAIAADPSGSARTAGRGVAVPAPPVKSTPGPQTHSRTPAPPPVSLVEDAALPTLVPDIATVSQVMGAARLQIIDKLNGPGMFTDTTNPPECANLVISAPRAAYGPAGARATYVQAMHDQNPGQLHTVFNAVTTFATESAAADFVRQQAITWQGCRVGAIVLDPDKDRPLSWTVHDVTQRGEQLTANVGLQSQHALCQRALMATRNVVIDVDACGDNPAGAAVMLASRISQRLGS